MLGTTSLVYGGGTLNVPGGNTVNINSDSTYDTLSGTGTTNIGSGYSLTLTGTGTYDGYITGTGSLRSNGTLTLTQASTFAGSAYVNVGTLNVNENNSFGYLFGSGTVNLASGKTLTLSTGGTYGGYLKGTGTVRVGVSSSATMTLTGDNTGANAFPGFVTFLTGSALNVNNNTSVAFISGAGTANIGSGYTLTLTSSSNLTYSGTFTGADATSVVSKTGSGTTTLTGASTFAGTVDVSAGTVNVTQDNTFAKLTGTGTTTIASGRTLTLTDIGTYAGYLRGNGTLNVTNSLTLTGSNAGVSNPFIPKLNVAGGAAFNMNENNSFDTLTGTGTTSIAATKTLTLTGTSTYGGYLTGTGTISSTGTTTLTGANTGVNAFTGTVNVTGGVLHVNENNTFANLTGNGWTNIASGKTLSLTGTGTYDGYLLNYGTLNVTNSLTLTGASTGVNAFYGTVDVTGGTLNVNENNTFAKLTGTGTTSIAAGKTLTLIETGTYGGYLTGTGTISHAGTTTLTGANIGVNAFAGTVDVTGGTLNVNENNTFAKLTGTGVTSIADGKTLTVTDNGTYDGIFDGSGTLNSTGAMTLTGNTVAYDLTMNVDGSGALNFNEHTLLAKLTGTGPVNIASGKILVLSSASNFTYGGVLSGGDATSTISKTGSGTTTLTAASNFPGVVDVSAGTLSVNNNSTFFKLTGSGTTNIGGGYTLTLNTNADFTYAGSFTGTGTLGVVIGSGNTADFTGDISGFNGSIGLQAGTLKTLNLDPSRVTKAGNGSHIAKFNAPTTLSNAFTSANGQEIFFEGGQTLTLNANNTLNGATTVRDSTTLSVSSAAQLGSTTTILNLADNGRLSLAQGLATLNKPLYTTSNTGYLDLLGDTTLSGTTTVNPGTTLETTVPSDKTVTFSDLAGSGGLFRLQGGGEVLATGSSPNLDIRNGTFTVNTGNYGANDGVDVTIGNLGILKINSGASINFFQPNINPPPVLLPRVLTLEFGDGSVGGSGPLTSGWIDNTANSTAVDLPPTVNTTNDGTFTIGDTTLVHKDTKWKLVDGPYTGGDTLSVDNNMTLGGMVSWDLVRDPTVLWMKISGDSLLPALTTTSSTAFGSSTEIGDQVIAQSFAVGKGSNDVMPDKESFRSFGRKLASFGNRLKSFINDPSSRKREESESIQAMEASLEQPKIRLKTSDNFHNLWVGSLYTKGYNKKTEFTSESYDVQEGILVGSEWNDEKSRRFTGVTLGFTLGEHAVSSQKLYNTKFKTGIVGAYVSQSFFTTSEWDLYGTLSESRKFNQRVANPTTKPQLVHSRSKSRQLFLGTQLNHIFKLIKNEEGKTLFSIKPLIGISTGHFKRPSYTEFDGGVLNIRRSTLKYTTRDIYAGLGIRRRLSTESYSIKITGEIKISKNLNNPKVQDSIYTAGTTERGLLIKNQGASPYTINPTLDVIISPRSKAWKANLSARSSFDKSRTSYSFLARVVFPLGVVSEKGK